MLGWLGLVSTMLVEGLLHFAEHWYVFDLLRHLPLQVAWATGGALVLGLFVPPCRAEAKKTPRGIRREKSTLRRIWQGIRPRHRWWWPLFFLFLLQLSRVLPFFISLPSFMLLPVETTTTSLSSSEVSVLSANVLTGNLELAELGTWISEKDPDVLVLVEVSEKQLKQLSPALGAYLYSLALPHDSPLGMALFSKFSFREHDVVAVENSPSAFRV
ncbi:MAG: endonuclease/exonuclease/phosphatase family protein [Deltaproteobacteria bacterium]|nr:endonuclease/exonuclease/phosphatase family protein [Deltaproteobacteria bacterium]